MSLPTQSKGIFTELIASAAVLNTAGFNTKTFCYYQNKGPKCKPCQIRNGFDTEGAVDLGSKKQNMFYSMKMYYWLEGIY